MLFSSKQYNASTQEGTLFMEIPNRLCGPNGNYITYYSLCFPTITTLKCSFVYLDFMACIFASWMYAQPF